MAYQTEEQQKFHEVLTRFDTGMLITHGNHYRLHGRPMAIAQVEDDGTLWFMTGYDSPKTDEIRSNGDVLVTFQNKRDEFVTLQGRATLVRDPLKLDELWRDTFKVWFPEGKNDPNLVLIQVEPDQGEYWDNAGMNKMTYLAEAVRAYVAGETPDVSDQEHHGRVNL